MLFHGRELGRAPWDEYIAPPKDEWFKVPLFIGDDPIGTLSLDNGADPCRYSRRRATTASRNCWTFSASKRPPPSNGRRLHERANRQAQETQILSDIGRAVTTKAAQGSLEDLLETIREQLGKELGLDISNFMAVLLDEETGYLDFRCHYEGGVQAAAPLARISTRPGRPPDSPEPGRAAVVPRWHRENLSRNASHRDIRQVGTMLAWRAPTCRRQDCGGFGPVELRRWSGL